MLTNSRENLYDRLYYIFVVLLLIVNFLMLFESQDGQDPEGTLACGVMSKHVLY